MASKNNQVGKKGFAYGWGLQVLVAIMFFFYAGISIDGLNVSVPAFASENGWDYASILILSTPAGLAGLVGIFSFSHIASKKGPKAIIITCFLGTGIVCFLYGNARSIPMYFISLCLLSFFVSALGNVATGALTANWFPRKRSLALGLSASGMPIASAVFVPVFSVLIDRYHINGALSIVGIVVILLGIISIFWVKNTPEEMGLPPDGDESGLEELEETRREIENYISDWTIPRLISNKTVWTQSICYGLLFLTTSGIVSQMVPRLMEQGHDKAFGLSMLSLAAVIAIFSSFAWGYIGYKLGTKKTTAIYSGYYAFSVIVLIASANSLVGTVVGICLVGFGIGGVGTLQPSMLAQTFGRFDYASASRVVTTLVQSIRIMAFVVIALAINMTGSIDGAYVFLIAGNIIALILAIKIDDTLIGRKG